MTSEPNLPEPATVDIVSPGARLGAPLPWWAKIAVKLLLARMPVPHHLWRRIGVFRHGCLAADIERRGSVVLQHVARYHAASAAPLRRIVEIGPGDSVAGALWATALGIAECWLVDVGRFAVDDPAHYRAVLHAIVRRGLPAPALPDPGGLGSVLDATGATYRTDGIAAFTAMPDGSVDLVFSQAVLEHIPLCQFGELLAETRRVLRPGGVASHVVDLQDHLGGGLNNLRFAPRLWESRPMASSGFYTNRLGYREICEQAQRAGFSVAVPHMLRWSELPTPRATLHRTFRHRSDQELSVSCFTLVLQKPVIA